MQVKLPHDKQYSKKIIQLYWLKQYIIIFSCYDLTYIAIAPFTILYTHVYKSNTVLYMSMHFHSDIYTVYTQCYWFTARFDHNFQIFDTKIKLTTCTVVTCW